MNRPVPHQHLLLFCPCTATQLRYISKDHRFRPQAPATNSENIGKPCDQGGTKRPCTDKCLYDGMSAMPFNLIFSHKERNMIQVATGSVILPAMMLPSHANRLVFAREVRSVTIQRAIVGRNTPKTVGFRCSSYILYFVVSGFRFHHYSLTLWLLSVHGKS